MKHFIFLLTILSLCINAFGQDITIISRGNAKYRQLNIVEPSLKESTTLSDPTKIFENSKDSSQSYKLSSKEILPFTEDYSFSEKKSILDSIVKSRRTHNTEKRLTPFDLLDTAKLDSEQKKLLEGAIHKKNNLPTEKTSLAPNLQVQPQELSPATEDAEQMAESTNGNMLFATAATPSIDYGRAVGKTPGAFSVSLTGAATYSIPIEVPPGVQGMAPNLSLVYSSQAGMGVAGMGWSIGGISTISRMGKTHYLDGRVSGVQFDNTDHFVLDGQVLIPVAGANGANGTEYRTENESFVRVFSHGQRGTGPAYFTVYTKDGKKMIYGWDEDAYIKVSGRIEPMAWVLVQAEDSYKNYMEYTYMNDLSTGVPNIYSGDFGLSRINYGDNPNGVSANNYVDFIYGDDVNKFPVYSFEGKQYKRYKYLKEIRTYAGGELVKIYALEYITDPAIERFYLSKITEKNAAGSYLNSTVFEMETKTEESGQTYVNGQTHTSFFGQEYTTPEFAREKRILGTVPQNIYYFHRLIGDINGDGLSDIVSFGVNKYVTGHYYNRHVIGFSNGDGTFNIIPSNELIFPAIYDGLIDMTLLDMNGDGKSDLVLLSKTGIHVALSNGIDFNSSTCWASEFSYDNERLCVDLVMKNVYVGLSESFTIEGKNPVLFADMNCDGLVDIVKITGEGVYIYLNKGNRFEYGYHTSEIKAVSGNNYFATDFNGDRIPDVLMLKNSGTQQGAYVITSTGSSFNPMKFWTGAEPMCGSVFQKKVLVQDMNSDGLADMAHFYGNQMKVVYSTGESFQYHPGGGVALGLQYPINLQTPERSFSRVASSIYLMDINNDGYPDPVMTVSAGLVISLYSPKGPSSLTHKGVGILPFGDDVDKWMASGQYPHSFGDFDGDGVLDFVQFGETITRVKLGKPYNYTNKLATITDGFLDKTEITYKYQRPQTHSKDLVYPYTNLGAPVYLTSTTKESNNLTNITPKQLIYYYSEPVTHLKGKGFLGFRQISCINGNDLSAWSKKFNLSTSGDYIYGLQLLEDQTFDQEWKLAKTEYTYNYTNYSNKRFWQRLTGTFNHTTLHTDPQGEDFYLMVNLGYDNNNGNCIRNNEIYAMCPEFESTTAVLLTNTISTTYSQYGTWLIRPTRIVVEKGNTLFSEGLITNTTSFVYDRIYLSEKIVEPDIPQYRVSTKYSAYNTYGHPANITITPAEGSAYATTTNYAYDPTGRFLTQVTNPMGHITKYECEPKFGNLKKLTDPNGLVTSYEYDHWGQLAKTTTPDGFVTNYALKWTANAETSVAGALYCKQETPFGEYAKEVHYDALGREVESICHVVRERDTDTPVFPRSRVRTEYDEKSRVARKSLPFKENATPAEWISYTYDVLSRIKTEKGPYIDKTYTYSPTNNTVTVTDLLNNNSTTSQRTNPIGQLTEATDPGGTLYYAYNAKGQTKTIRYNTLTTSISYDIVGNRTQLNDPNAGITTYEHNSLGQLTKETNANGYYTTYAYDKLGRVKQKWVNGNSAIEGSATYTYDSGNKALGKLSSVVANGIHTSSYTFDNLARLSQSTENIEGRAYNTLYEYDGKSRLKKMTYPNGYVLNYTYKTSSDQLDYIRDANNNPVWRFYTGNVYGLPVRADLGNGLSTHHTYSSSGMLTGIKTSDANGTTNIVQNLQYTYNSRGLMDKRHDIKNNQYETFQYDNLGRLTQDRQVRGGYTSPYNNNTYDNNGNLKSQGLFGQYDYTLSNHPNALSKFTTASSYSTNCYTSYTPFNKIKQISESPSSIDFLYGNDQQRVKAIIKNNGSTVQTNYYVSADYEEEIKGSVTRKLNYLRANGKLFAIFVQETGKTDQMYYVHTDHLGSYDVITNNSKTIVETYSFTPFGFRRINNNWTELDGRSSFLFSRGFTGHEHYDQFPIINMNGRLYDPVLGRFFSPDPYVADATGTQDFNRYTYARNNPLSYIDPSGEIPWFVPLIIGAAVGAYIGASLESGTAEFWNWTSDAWKGAIVGGIIGAGVGSIFSAGALPALGINVSGMTTAAGSTTLSWSMTSSALVGGNVSMAVNAIEGYKTDELWKSGVLGFFTGAISGGADFLSIGNFYADEIRLAGQLTSSFTYGFSDANIKLRKNGIEGWELFGYSMLSGFGGTLTGFVFGSTGIQYDFSPLSTTAFTSLFYSAPSVRIAAVDAIARIGSLMGIYDYHNYLYRTNKYPRTATEFYEEYINEEYLKKSTPKL